MRCQKLRSLLPAYCSRELEKSVTSAMECHLHECQRCREDLASHRLIATTIANLAYSAPTENHENHAHSQLEESLPLLKQPFEKPEAFESQAMNKPDFTALRVSADFNNQLMERIARERFTETRARASTKAFLPHNAPRFVYRRLVPALVSVTAVVALVFGSLQQGAFDRQNTVADGSALQKPVMSMAFKEDDPALIAPALGEQLGLSDEYMTAQPINNPVYRGASANPTGAVSSPSATQSASLVSSQGTRPLSSSRRWHFARDYARARRILSISNALCRRGAYFRIVQFDAQGVLIGPVGGVVFQCGPATGQRAVGVPQIIVQPLPNAPVREQAPQGRMVRGSF